MGTIALYRTHQHQWIRAHRKVGQAVRLPFKVFVFDPNGGPITLPNDKITIVRTAASIDAIPASHSIGVEAREKLGGRFSLGHRVVRIEDTQSDRKRLLEELQAQIPAVLTTPRERSRQLLTQRSETAAVVDRLEADLTAYHEAVYAPDDLLGLSYRHIVSRIAALEIDAQGLAAPDLRPLLGKLKPAELEAVVGECLGLAETWYEADLARPVLSIFRPFGSDIALEQRLAEGFAQLREAEDKRRRYIAEAAPISGLPMNAEESALRDWLKEAGTRLRSLSASARSQTHSFAHLFTDATT